MAVDDSVVRAGYSSTLLPLADVSVAGGLVRRRILVAILRRRRRISLPEKPLQEEDRVGALGLSVVGGVEADELAPAREEMVQLLRRSVAT